MGYVHSKPDPDLRPMQVDLYPRRVVWAESATAAGPAVTPPQLAGLACCMSSIALLEIPQAA